MHARVERTIDAAEFKANCLELLARLASRKLDRLTVVKRGRPVAVPTPPDAAADVAALHGCLAGAVTGEDGVDLTESALYERLHAELGRLHQ